MIPGSTKVKCVKILKYLQWMVMEVMEGHGIINKLVCTSHDEVHKSEVNSPPVYWIASRCDLNED